MRVIYSDQEPNELNTHSAIFLAGPTPRDKKTPSWRPQALEILNKMYTGTVFVPERSNWDTLQDYNDQVEWEHYCLEASTAILFWVPRDMSNMPALTTNVEFGYWLATRPKDIYYGRPDNAHNIQYLDWLYHKKNQVGRTPFNDLQLMLAKVTWDEIPLGILKRPKTFQEFCEKYSI